MPDNRPALIDEQIITAIVELLSGINGYPDYHNSVAGNVITDLPINQIIHEEQRYPVICVNEDANPSTDVGTQIIGNGEAHYTFDLSIQIVGVHKRDKARSLRADILKAIPIRGFVPGVQLVTLVDTSMAFQPANSALLIALVNYQFQYSRVIGHKVT